MKDALRRRGPSLAILLLVIGHFSPWAAHKTAALTLSAHDLAVFANFTPNAGVFFNEGFMLPLWAAALLCALASTRSARVRWTWLGLALVLAALGLPGYPELRKLIAGQPSEFVAQLAVSAGVMALCAGLGLTRRAPARVLVIAATAAALVPLAGFLLIRNDALARLYGDSVGLGWGWWMTLFSAFWLIAVAFVTIFPMPASPDTLSPQLTRTVGDTALLTRRSH
jgi:hypothetical protein